MRKGLGYRSIFRKKANLWLVGLVLLSGCTAGKDMSPVTAGEAAAPATQEALVAPELNISPPLAHPATATADATEETARPVYFTPTPTHALTPDLVPQLKFCSPLEDHSLADLQDIITFPYDPPPPGKDTGHHGVDFAYYRRGERLSILGVPIHSVLSGKVSTVNANLVPYGFMVIVETTYEQLPAQAADYLGIPPSESLYLLYAHMNELPLVEGGSEVECGQTLGYVGNTPENWSSAPHLHFEARYGPPGGQFAGMQFYDKRSQVVQMEKYTLWRMSGEYVLLDPLALLEYGLGSASGVGN